MRTKQQKIELLMRFIRGEIPASELKSYKVVFFIYMSPEQLKEIQDITGPVIKYRSKYMPDGERAAGLFGGIPVGFTAIWHLSMIMHPNSDVDVITGNRPELYNQFIEKLKTSYNY